MLTLIEGEIYYEDMGNGKTYISLYKENEDHNNIYIQVNRKTFNKTGAAIKLKNVKRLATDEEKAWLEHCITEDKFVEYEEFMKVYKPQFIVGQWYKNIGSCQDYIAPFVGIEDSRWLSNNKREYIWNNVYKTDSAKYISSNFENATLVDIQEIQEFLPQDHPDKQLDIKQIQEECKKRFPIGCKYKGAGSSIIYTLNEKEDTYEILEENIDAGFGQGYLYYEGKYAELIEAPEVIIPEYVEYIDTLYKGTIVKVEDWCCGSYCKVIFYNGNKEQPFKHLVKQSTKSAYDLQNLKQQPLTTEQSYNTKIEVGDEVWSNTPNYKKSNLGGNDGFFGTLLGISGTNYRYRVSVDNRIYDYGDSSDKETNYVWCESVKLIKKANKNTTTTTLNKKVDVSSPKVTDKITVPRINTTSYDTLVHINIETNTKSIKIPKLETNTPEIKKIKIQSLTLTI